MRYTCSKKLLHSPCQSLVDPRVRWRRLGFQATSAARLHSGTDLIYAHLSQDVYLLPDSNQPLLSNPSLNLISFR